MAEISGDDEVVFKQTIFDVKEEIVAQTPTQSGESKVRKKTSTYIDMYSKCIIYDISSENVVVLLLGLILYILLGAIKC